MSSETQERETELVVGTIGGITQKKADTWTVDVRVDGLQNPKRLWTKDADLVESLSTKFGQVGAFVCGASYWQHPQHGQVRSLWIDSMDTNAPDGDGDGNAPERVDTPDATRRNATYPAEARIQVNKTAGDGMSKEEWARKDSAIHKMACIKTAADALKHTLPSDPSADDISRFLSRVSILSTAWHDTVIAQRDDPTGENVPF